MTDAATVGQLLEQIDEIGLQISVYQELSEHLAQFIKTDTHDPTMGIKDRYGGQDVVPEGIVLDVRAELDDKISVLKKEIDALKGRPVSGAKKAPAPRRKTSVKEPKAAKKGAGRKAPKPA